MVNLQTPPVVGVVVGVVVTENVVGVVVGVVVGEGKNVVGVVVGVVVGEVVGVVVGVVVGDTGVATKSALETKPTLFAAQTEKEMHWRLNHRRLFLQK